MATCIVTGVTITTTTECFAHIIPQSLGGKLGSKAILSSCGNEILNKNFDIPLYKALHSIALILNVHRDRGEHYPVDFVDDSGAKLIYRPSGNVQIRNPIIISENLESNIETTVHARNEKEALKIAKGIIGSRSREPDVELEISDPSPYVGMTSSELTFGIDYKTSTLMPSIFSILSTFLAANDFPVHPKFKSYVYRHMVDNEEQPPDMLACLLSPKRFDRPAEPSHYLGAFASAKTQKIISYVELFGVIGFRLIFDHPVSHNQLAEHTIDLRTGKNINIGSNQSDLFEDIITSSDTSALATDTEYSRGIRIECLLENTFLERAIKDLLASGLERNLNLEDLTRLRSTLNIGREKPLSDDEFTAVLAIIKNECT